MRGSEGHSAIRKVIWTALAVPAQHTAPRSHGLLPTTLPLIHTFSLRLFVQAEPKTDAEKEAFSSQ